MHNIEKHLHVNNKTLEKQYEIFYITKIDTNVILKYYHKDP